MPRSKIVRYTTEELKEFERRGQTKTDWKRVKAMRDEDILIDEDSPEITAEMWRNAVVTGRRPPKRNITLRIDPEIIEWFKAKGKGYQTRMNARAAGLHRTSPQGAKEGIVRVFVGNGDESVEPCVPRVSKILGS